jgi:hypothetical protein
MRFRALLATLVLVTALAPARAQEPAAAELLRRVPDNLGLCVVVSDLRGQLDRLQQQEWFKKIDANPLVAAVRKSPEFGQVKRFQRQVEQQLGVNLDRIRDDVFGDAVVFGYQPPPRGQTKGERAIFLVKAKDAELLGDLITKVNDLQKQLGELTSLTSLEYRDLTYYKRVDARATHYYLRQGPLLIVASDEDLLKAAIDRGSESRSIPLEHLRRAKLDKAVFSVWFNPRVMELELEHSASKKLGAEGVILENMLKFWKGLDGVVLGCSNVEQPEGRITLLAKSGNDAREWLTSSRQPSDLWSRFPEKSIVACAFQIDFAKLVDEVQKLAPQKDRKALQDAARSTIGAATGLDVFGQIVPNLGPDVGFAVFAAENEKDVPQGIFALAVKPEPKNAPIDKAIQNWMPVFIGVMVFQHNSEHVGKPPVQIRTERQGSVEVKYLAQDNVFPPGFQPAFAVKDGYLVLATSPKAIARFKSGPAVPAVNGEIPLVKISPVEMARLLRQRRDLFANKIAGKDRDNPAAARETIDAVADLLQAFEAVHLLQHTADGSGSWIARLIPTK